MNKQATHEAILVMKAWLDGAEVETRSKHDESSWRLMPENPVWSFGEDEYRIKPVPREWWVKPNTIDDDAGYLHPHDEDCEAFGCIKVREVLNEDL